MKLITLFFIVIFVFTGCKDKTLSSKYLTNVSAVRETNEIKKEETLPKKIVKEENNFSIPKTQTPQTKYYIIVGSFSNSERNKAERLTGNLKSKGYPATIINSDNRYRVSIESFTNNEEAEAARSEYCRTTDREDLWILKYRN